MVSSRQHSVPKSISSPIVYSGPTIVTPFMLLPCLASIKSSTILSFSTPASSPTPQPPSQPHNPALNDYIAQFEVAVSQHSFPASASRSVLGVSSSGAMSMSPSSSTLMTLLATYLSSTKPSVSVLALKPQHLSPCLPISALPRPHQTAIKSSAISCCSHPV